MSKAIKHLSDLTSDPHNRRSHTPRGVGMIENALSEVGAARSIVIDENGVVLAGNATIEAAAAAGIERVQVVDTDGETLVAVRRSGLSDDAKRKLAMYDNRAGELSGWNPDQLLADAQEGLDLDRFFRKDEIDRLTGAAPQVDIDAMWQGMPEFEQKEAGAFRSIAVHFLSQDDVDAFANLVGQVVGEKTKSIWYPNRTQRRRAPETYQREP